MRILLIDPGSTSTKVGIYERSEGRGSTTPEGCLTAAETLRHDRKVIDSFRRIIDQEEMRYQAVERWLASRCRGPEAGPGRPARFDAVVGRGGLIRPVAGGAYQVNDAMLRDLGAGIGGQHASNLGGILAHRFAERFGVPAYIVDPVVVDEMEPEARFSGLKGIRRRSIFHALNHRAVAGRAAAALGKSRQEVNLIVAHLGGGISVAAHRKGRVVDVNNALNGDGPFAPERAGGLPLDGVARFLEETGSTMRELLDTAARRGGLYSYVGEVELERILRMIEAGSDEAASAFRAMAYQVSKEIGALAAVLAGDVDAVVLTGGGANCGDFTALVEERVRFIAPVMRFPGELELEALGEGAARVLSGEETAGTYPPAGPPWARPSAPLGGTP